MPPPTPKSKCPPPRMSLGHHAQRNDQQTLACSWDASDVLMRLFGVCRPSSRGGAVRLACDSRFLFHLFLVATLLLHPLIIQLMVRFFEGPGLNPKPTPLVPTLVEHLDLVLWDGLDLVGVNAKGLGGSWLSGLVSKRMREPPIPPCMSSTSSHIRASLPVEFDWPLAFSTLWIETVHLLVIHWPVSRTLVSFQTPPQTQSLALNVLQRVLLQLLEEQAMEAVHANGNGTFNRAGVEAAPTLCPIARKYLFATRIPRKLPPHSCKWKRSSTHPIGVMRKLRRHCSRVYQLSCRSNTSPSNTICCGNVLSRVCVGASTSCCHPSAAPMSSAPWLEIQRSINECTVLARSGKVSQARGKFKPHFCRIGCEIFA